MKGCDWISGDFEKAGRVLKALTFMVMIFFGMGFAAAPSVKAGPTELHVGPGQSYTTIQSAVDAVSPGDVIIVHPGTYMETVDVTKSYITIGSLLGDPSDVIVDAGGADDHVFNITNQAGVTLTGFTIRNARSATKDVSGLYVYGSTDCRISNNVITNMWSTDLGREVYGIWLGNSSRCNISNNVVTNIVSPRGLAEGASLVGVGNKFFNMRISNIEANYSATGIFVGGSNNTFSDTHISGINANDAFGIHVLGSYIDGLARYNKFANTYISNISAREFVVHLGTGGHAYGIALIGWKDCTDYNEFSNTHISNITSLEYVHGVYLFMYSDGNKFSNTYITNLHAKDNAYGITLFNYSRSPCYNNFFNTHIFNVTSVSADAFGILLASLANWNNFTNTYIFNLNAGRNAYDIYDGGHDNVFSNTYSYFDLLKDYNELKTEYDALLQNYSDLLVRYEDLNSTYHGLLGGYEQLQKECADLVKDYNELKSDYNELTTFRNLTYLFIITTTAFIATTIYFARRKPKIV